MKRVYTRYDYWLTLACCLAAAAAPYFVLWHYGYETNLDPARVAKFVLAALGGVLAGLAAAMVYHLAAAAAKWTPVLPALATAAAVATATTAVVRDDSDHTPLTASPSAADTTRPVVPAVADSASLAPHPDFSPSSAQSAPVSAASPNFNSISSAAADAQQSSVSPQLPSASAERPEENKSTLENSRAEKDGATADPELNAPSNPALHAIKSENDIPGPDRSYERADHLALGDWGYPIFVYFNRPERIERDEKNFVTYDSRPSRMFYGNDEKVVLVGDQKHLHVDLSFVKSRLDSETDVALYTTQAFDKWVVVKVVRQGTFESSSGYADVNDSDSGKLEGYVLEYIVAKKNQATGEATHLLKIYCPRVYKKLSSAKKHMDFRVVPK